MTGIPQRAELRGGLRTAALFCCTPAAHWPHRSPLTMGGICDDKLSIKLKFKINLNQGHQRQVGGQP